MQIESNDMGPMQLKKRQNPLGIPKETEDLIVAGVSENTLVAYRRATRSLETQLNGQVLNDPMLVTYINPSW